MKSLEETYNNRFNSALHPLSLILDRQMNEIFGDLERIDRISVRPKSPNSFLKKSRYLDKNGKIKYNEPLDQIQDQIGARITTFYLSDVIEISKIVERYYRPVEIKSHIPDSEWEFGYFGRHYILFIPSDVSASVKIDVSYPEFFELQIKTLFQHAWSEANHDLGYKEHDSVVLEGDQKRLLAFASAQAWGADRVFNELFDTISKAENS